MFFNHPFKEIAARNLGIQLPGLGAPHPKQKAKASAKGRAPPPPKGGPPPKGKAPPAKQAAPPPKWKGPAPSNDWKANCLVNWKPIREAKRLEGSVWQKLSRRKGGVAQVPSGLVDDLNKAFMSKASAEQPRRRSFVQRPSVMRLLPRSKALQADILHAKLTRSGIRSSEQVAWATKPRVNPEVTPVPNVEEGAAGCIEEASERQEPASLEEVPATSESNEDSSLKLQGEHQQALSKAEGPPEMPPEVSPEVPVAQELSADVLEALLGLLSLVDLDFVAAVKNGPSTQAPAELFLQELLAEVEDLEIMRAHVRAALHIARFEETKSVEVVLQRGIKAVRGVIDSKVIPIFLEGVLLVGNYVNSSSTALSGAFGVTLESLANLAHTRTKQGTQQVNALHFVVGHLQRTHPNLVEMLAEDLEDCRSLQGLDTMALADMISQFVSQVQAVEALVRDECSEGTSMPDALEPSRVQRFLSGALPQVKRLTDLLQELNQAAADLRSWFAEPQERQLVDMLSSLAQLREALPVSIVLKRSRKRRGERSERKGRQQAPVTGEDACAGSDDKAGNVTRDGGLESSAEQATDSAVQGNEDARAADLPAAPLDEAEHDQQAKQPEQDLLPDPWGDALQSLTQALTYIEENSSHRERANDEYYEAPLSNLEAVLAQIAPVAETAAETRPRRDSRYFEFDELDELEDQMEQMEQEHLGVLENVLQRAKPRAVEHEQHLGVLENVLQRAKPRAMEHEQHLGVLQNVLQHAKPRVSHEQFDEHVLELQSVLASMKQF